MLNKFEVPENFDILRNKTISKVKKEVKKRHKDFPKHFNFISKVNMIENIIFFEAFKLGEKYGRTKRWAK